MLGLAGCDIVGVRSIAPKAYIAERRGDVLSTRALSDSTIQALNVVAISKSDCAANFARCTNTLLFTDGLNDEQRLSTLSELWLASALQLGHADDNKPISDQALHAYLESARYAYAYLFFTARTPEQRAFEIRQSQVLDFYNFSVQRAVTSFFHQLPTHGDSWAHWDLAGWNILRPTSDVTMGDGEVIPHELLPAAGLRFNGLRNIYKRDGFGSEFVAIGAPTATDNDALWREQNYVPMTAVLQFPGDSLKQVLDTDQVRLLAKNPYLDSDITIGQQTIPLAANFTAPYGIWLARSGFAKQSIRSLLGRGGISKPQILLMQPFDPNRLTVIMLHGLASSPEAWINVVNEVMGDDRLRRSYQVWEVYYPTNVPVAVNLAQIRRAIDGTLHHFDPTGRSVASNNIVLIGHSMGGVIARLLVSSSGDKLWDVVPVRADLSATDKQKLHDRLRPYLEFTPMPQVTRAVFLAAPHSGTPYAQSKLARWIGNFIRLPATLLHENLAVTDAMQKAAPSGVALRIPNSIDNLNSNDPFIRAASTLPISPKVHYHTIVGVYKSKGPLEDSSDGVVPYASAHLAGADSELAIPSWHSVQETPQAIIELRRILHLHAAELHCLHGEGTADTAMVHVACTRAVGGG
jgi:pimeloyl-ACP methyl ester carboxylesterase